MYSLGCFFINYGNIESPSRNNNFPLMDCVKKRILIWDEAYCDRFFYEHMKKLMSGEPLSVSIKFQSNKTVRKTPIIMASNNYVFPNEESFNCRIIKHEWRYAPWLTAYNKGMIHPAAIGAVMCYANMYATKVIDYTVLDKNTCNVIRDSIVDEITNN